jgi:hypothetical protein
MPEARGRVQLTSLVRLLVSKNWPPRPTFSAFRTGTLTQGNLDENPHLYRPLAQYGTNSGTHFCNSGTHEKAGAAGIRDPDGNSKSAERRISASTQGHVPIQAVGVVAGTLDLTRQRQHVRCKSGRDQGRRVDTRLPDMILGLVLLTRQDIQPAQQHGNRDLMYREGHTRPTAA